MGEKRIFGCGSCIAFRISVILYNLPNMLPRHDRCKAEGDFKAKVISTIRFQHLYVHRHYVQPSYSLMNEPDVKLINS